MGPYLNEYAAAMKAEAKKLGKKIHSKKLEWKRYELDYVDLQKRKRLYHNRKLFS